MIDKSERPSHWIAAHAPVLRTVSVRLVLFPSTGKGFSRMYFNAETQSFEIAVWVLASVLLLAKCRTTFIVRGACLIQLKLAADPDEFLAFSSVTSYSKSIAKLSSMLSNQWSTRKKKKKKKKKKNP